MTEKLEACAAFNNADYEWHEALIEAFGREGGQARYEERGKGEDGSDLRAAYEARESARLKWEGLL